MTRALILVDLQNDFMPGGALAVNDGDAMVPLANELMQHYDVVAATQDWHPPQHASFAASHAGRQVFDIVDLDGLQQVLWPVHCVQETAGAEFHADLNTTDIDVVVPKGTNIRIDSYSGFFDNDHRQATGLAEALRERDVDAVDVLGLATDYCVKATVIDAARLGFQPRVLLPACRAVAMQPDDEAKAIVAMRDAGAQIMQQLPIGTG